MKTICYGLSFNDKTLKLINVCMPMCSYVLCCIVLNIKKVNEYVQIISQSYTADQPTTPLGSATEQ